MTLQPHAKTLTMAAVQLSPRDMMTRVLRILVVLAMWAIPAAGEAAILSRADQIRSHAINEQLSIDIYAPCDSAKAGSRCPVMYVMDSQHYFFNAVAYQQSLRFGVEMSPEFIVVGINTEKLNEVAGARAEQLHRNPDSMIELLEDEIIPYVDAHYPSNHRRMYFGWQYAAGFGLELFNQRPDLFEAYFLASSPTFTDQRLARAAELLRDRDRLNHWFNLSLGESETYATGQFAALAALLEQHSDKGVRVRYRLSDQLVHQTTPLDSFTRGLSWYFEDFPELTFHSLQEVESFGGVPAVKAYYRNRGARYGLEPTVGNQARFSMFRHAAEADSWSTFQSFEKELGAFDLAIDASPHWYRLFGRFFTRHAVSGKAEMLYRSGLKQLPESSLLWGELAGVLEAQGRLVEARAAYRSALEHTSADDGSRSEYQQAARLLDERMGQDQGGGRTPTAEQ